MKLISCSAIALSLVALGACATKPAAPTEIVYAGPATQENWEAGQIAYTAWNAQQRGWTTTASGLQYRLVGKANKSGTQPVAADTVKVHYRGTFIDGREFDSSYSRNEPASFPLNRVIKGWTEGVALMRTGETYEFVIPSDLAYGDRWVGGKIPANSTLKFTVELLEVNPVN